MQLQAAGILLCKKCIRAARRGISVSTAWSRSSENYYDVLGVKQEASLDEIKQAFFKRSRKVRRLSVLGAVWPRPLRGVGPRPRGQEEEAEPAAGGVLRAGDAGQPGGALLRIQLLPPVSFLSLPPSLLPPFCVIHSRKLEEAHNSFMDEKDRVITEIYKESKERARMNGLKKQQEILRQKHAEFVEKYRNRSDK
ncbi:uncharacterized protein LOC117969906 isoform X3 [Acipenser ruthenus]|uniref:uncharacterized protein LOC117969906 isoform X3 n=1 Tax=Acipenser ruthenus TaxID=7906 RepID=UPI002740F911|nr:uncharacterized protein LOC117969906 isoform X3 [Acipenser ruthenus]